MESKQVKRDREGNHLVYATSPYLLQHAGNPVDWYPWGLDALNKARNENKLLVVSIGYAACHWCHVMEEESFENEDVARIMNEYYVAIKVDREERPDIDQIYMSAAQLLTGGGGWPLNVIALPDGRPVYVGTYFPREKWISVLQQLQSIYKATPQRLVDQAKAITEGIKKMDVIQLKPEPEEFELKHLQQVYTPWQIHNDSEKGGLKGAPKFPLPVGYQFLLGYYFITGEQKAFDAVKALLDNLAFGGIYDQVGGGFARYSTDNSWKVPHFEKMLYDNAQLVSLYGAAFQITKDPLYREVVYETLDFVERELTSPEFSTGEVGFYSSLDADSEGEEGKFYLWSKSEIRGLPLKNADLISDYFQVLDSGNWEKGKNILIRNSRDEAFAVQKKMTVKALQQQVRAAKKVLLKARSQRVRPALDDKMLTAWNGLMVKGYTDAYRVFGEEAFLQKAVKGGNFLKNKVRRPDGGLFRNFKGEKAYINGFLDDYAFTIDAFIGLYQATFSEEWLLVAWDLLKYTLKHFYDASSGMFYYTSDLDPELITRKMEVVDNVIPASNSVMAKNLFLLGEYFYQKDYIKISQKMLNIVKDRMVRNGTNFANWGILLSFFVKKHFEVAITGQDWLAKRQQLDRHFLPNVIVMGGEKPGKLPLMAGKVIEGQTTIFVCKDKVCLLPVKEVSEALKQMKE